MERGSTKHGPELDEALKRETHGQVHGGRATHAEEWRQAEPAGEDQPRDPAYVGGTAPGLRPDEVEARSELARFLSPAVFPAVGQLLLEVASANEAPSHVVEWLRRLPAGREYENVSQVWQALGGGREERP